METVMYEGRIVSKDNFRVFIYDLKSESKLVNSWREFQEHLATGLWFASLEDVERHHVKKEEKIEEPIAVNVAPRKGRKKHANG